MKGQLVVLRTSDKNAPSPRQGDIFKITKVEKNGMAIAIVNLRTGGTKVVLFNSISSIDLEKLTNINFGIPDIFDRVRKLNTQTRNWAQPGEIGKDINIIKDDDTFFEESPTSAAHTDSPVDQECTDPVDMDQTEEEDSTGHNTQYDPSQGSTGQTDPTQRMACDGCRWLGTAEAGLGCLQMVGDDNKWFVMTVNG